MTDKNLPVIIDQSRRTWRERLDAGGIDLNKPVTLRDYIGQSVQLETGAVVKFQDPTTIKIAEGEKLSLALDQHYRYRLQYFDDYAAEAITVLVTFPALFHDEVVDIKALHDFLTRQRLLGYDIYQQQPPQQSEVGLFYRILKRIDDYVTVEKQRWDNRKDRLGNPHRVNFDDIALFGIDPEQLEGVEDQIHAAHSSTSWVNRHTRWVPAVQINAVTNYTPVKKPRIKLQHTGWGMDFQLHLPVHLVAQLQGPLDPDQHVLSGPEGELTVVTLTSRHDWEEVFEKLLVPEGCKVVDLCQPQSPHFMDTYRLEGHTPTNRRRKISDVREGVMGWYSAIIPALKERAPSDDAAVRFLALSAIPLLDDGQFETRSTRSTTGISIAPDAWVGWNSLGGYAGQSLTRYNFVVVSTDPRHFQSMILKACEGWAIFAKMLRNLIIDYDAKLAPLSDADDVTQEIIRRGQVLSELLGEVNTIAEATKVTFNHTELLTQVYSLESAIRRAVLEDEFFDFDGSAGERNLPLFVATLDCKGVNKQINFAEVFSESLRNTNYMLPETRIEYKLDDKWLRAQPPSEDPILPPMPSWWNWLMEKLFKGKK